MLVRQEYHQQKRPARGLLRSCVAKMTGLSRAQVIRLIARYSPPEVLQPDHVEVCDSHVTGPKIRMRAVNVRGAKEQELTEHRVVASDLRAREYSRRRRPDPQPTANACTFRAFPAGNLAVGIPSTVASESDEVKSPCAAMGAIASRAKSSLGFSDDVMNV